ncbi:MAG: rhodanese-like domain-containing protein [Bacteroidales bacterium]
MKNAKLFLLPLVLFAFTLVSCNKEEDKPKVNESEVLATYLASPESPLMKDFVNTDMPTIMPASEVKTLNETGQVYIMDIRSAADFALGHIPNAKNVVLANVAAHLDSVDLTPYTKVAKRSNLLYWSSCKDLQHMYATPAWL